MMRNGRNGIDTLAFTFIVLAVVLLTLASVMANRYYQVAIAVIGSAALGYAVFRILSKNTARRGYEEAQFTSLFKKDPYKKFKCPKCKTLCRVPRGKGKIKIHCPSCGHEFIKRS